MCVNDTAPSRLWYRVRRISGREPLPDVADERVSARVAAAEGAGFDQAITAQNEERHSMSTTTTGVTDHASYSHLARLNGSATFSARNVAIAAGLVLLALAAITELQRRFGINSVGISNAPHWIYQAESFLHGRWDVALPPTLVDIRSWHGKSYLFYPPLPAVVMLPFVAVFGLKTSDVLITSVCSALNLGLLFLLFEQLRASGLAQRSWRKNAILALLFYFGSINLWLSLGGRVWFTSQIITFTFTVLSLFVGLRRHYAWSAALLGCAVLGRGTVIPGFLFLLFLAWQDAGRRHEIERFVRSLWARRPEWDAIPWLRIGPVALFAVAAVAAYMARNEAVFGSPFETGYGLTVRHDFPELKTGPLSLTYAPANVAAYFFSFPRISFTSAVAGHVTIDMLNGAIAVGIFVTTPLFFLLFWRNRTFSVLRAALWATIALILVECLLFFGTGYSQFGTRYMFDAYPFVFLLFALNEVRVDWRIAALGVVGVVINAMGAYQFWTGHLIHI